MFCFCFCFCVFPFFCLEKNLLFCTFSFSFELVIRYHDFFFHSAFFSFWLSIGWIVITMEIYRLKLSFIARNLRFFFVLMLFSIETFWNTGLMLPRTVAICIKHIFSSVILIRTKRENMNKTKNKCISKYVSNFIQWNVRYFKSTFLLIVVTFLFEKKTSWWNSC